MADDDKKKGKRFGPRHNWAGKKRTPEEQKPVTPPENKAPKEEQGKLEGIADKPPARDPMPAPLPPGAPLPKIQFGAARMYLLGARALRHYSTFLTNSRPYAATRFITSSLYHVRSAALHWGACCTTWTRGGSRCSVVLHSGRTPARARRRTRTRDDGEA